MAKEVYNAADEDHVRRRTEELEAQAKREQEELKKILDTYAGRAFIWRILTECKIFSSSFTGDTEHTFFNEGKRAIGLQVLTEVLQLYPKAFTLMQSEATRRKQESDFQ